MFSFTYTPLQGVIPAEALETTMRAKGLALSGILVSAIGFINLPAQSRWATSSEFGDSWRRLRIVW